MARFVVVDTDVLIDFLRGRGPAADLVERLLRDNVFLTTVITQYEVVQGANYPDERSRITPGSLRFFFMGSFRSPRHPLSAQATCRENCGAEVNRLRPRMSCRPQSASNWIYRSRRKTCAISRAFPGWRFSLRRRFSRNSFESNRATGALDGER